MGFAFGHARVEVIEHGSEIGVLCFGERLVSVNQPLDNKALEVLFIERLDELVGNLLITLRHSIEAKKLSD